MPKANPDILSYATPDSRERFDRRALFWPAVVVLFFGTVLLTAGIGWASAVLQLLTSFALLLAWFYAAYGWGISPAKFLRLHSEGALGQITIFATGLGVISLLTLGLGLAGLLNQGVAIAIVSVGVLLSAGTLPRIRHSLSLRVDYVHWWWLLLVPLAGFTITCAMLPAGFLWGMNEPNGYDVVSYHLQVPREWYELGRIVPLTHNVFSFMPFNVEMHYLFAMHLMGGPWVAQFLAQMMHAVYIGLTIAAVYAAVTPKGRFAGIIAAIFAASTPWMSMLGAIAYNEGGLLLYGTLAIAWTMRATSKREFTIAGLMVGFACGCKLTGVPLLLIGLPVAVVTTHIIGRTIARRTLVNAAVFVSVGLLVFSPWLIRNAVWAGNPVFPEQQKLLGRAHFTPEQSDRFYKAHKPRPDQAAISTRIAELGRQVFGDFRFGYTLLPFGVVAILLSMRQYESRLLLLMLFGLTAFWIGMTHLQGRFYVLAIPIASIACGNLATKKWAKLVGAIAIAIYLISAPLLIYQLSEFNSRFSIDVMQAVGFSRMDNSERFRGSNPTSDRPAVLVGDASAFLYHLPMSKLHYRTVFDVNDAGIKTAVDAWTRDLPDDQEYDLWIDPGEVERFHRTYGTVGLNPLIAIPPNGPFISTRPKRSPSQPAPASAPSR